MKTLPRILFAFALLSILSGCATQHRVRLDALSDQAVEAPKGGWQYQLVSGSEDLEARGLFFKEIARHVRPALNRAGYEEAEVDQANVLIEIEASVSDPIYETRAFTDDTTHVHYGIGYGHRRRSGIGYSIGFHTQREQITVYDKVLEMQAFSVLANGEKGDEIWSLRVALRSRSTDYRSQLPYLVVAAEPYIGVQTPGEKVIVVSEASEEMKAYKADM